jgi:Helicase conserved C-terminal domain
MTERDAMVGRFQRGETHFFVATAQIGGVGITLTRAIVVIMMEALSDTSLWDQSIARAHRYINRNWDGILVFEFYNKSSPAEMEAKRKREGSIHLATAQAAAMVAQIRGRAGRLNDKEIEGMPAKEEVIEW